MKRLTALLLAMLLAFALFGCSSATTASQTPAAATAAATSAAPASGAAPAASAAAINPASVTMVYLANMTRAFCVAEAAQYETLAKKAGYKMIIADYQGNDEREIELLQTYCSQKVSGIIAISDGTISDRIVQIANEAKIPLLSDSTNLKSGTTKKLLTAGVELNAYECGAQCTKWIVDNYKAQGVNIADQSKLGFIVGTYSLIQSFNDRAQGATEAFQKAFPNCKNVYAADTVKEQKFNAESSYTETSAVLAAHPEIETWFIVGILDDFAQGSVRAVEAAGLDKKAICTSIGGEILITEWDKGYEGCWKACNFFTGADFANKLFPALESVIKGEKKVTELFADGKQSGEDYGISKITGINTDRATYLAKKK